MTKDINQTMKELAEYNKMLADLKAEIASLENEVKQYMTDNNLDEVLTDDGKATWREVISNRFDTTNFKKAFAELYTAYSKRTSCKRFTFNV